MSAVLTDVLWNFCLITSFSMALIIHQFFEIFSVVIIIIISFGGGWRGLLLSKGDQKNLAPHRENKIAGRKAMSFIAPHF